MTEALIKLSFYRDSPEMYPHGYWMAEAVTDHRPVDYDGSGATPLDAVMALAEQMYASIRANTGSEEAP